ncbi:DNA internalization-related competence protein ComEC/Rec2 [bacterium]|nr:DNA internalization-related competence protein ComEC/Rec2 [bacterium]
MSAPFVWIFISFSAGILAGVCLHVPAVCILIALFVAVISLRMNSFRIAAIAQLLLLFLAGTFSYQSSNSLYRKNELRNWVKDHESETVLVKAKLKETPEISSDFVVLRVEVLSISGKNIHGSARITVTGKIDHLPIVGDVIETYIRFRLPISFRAEGCFNYERYLQKEGIHVLGSIKNGNLIRITERGYGFRSWLSSVRLGMIHRLQHGFSQQDGGILRALWLDDRSGLQRETEQTLIDAGIFHVVAISGFHVTVLLLICFLVLKQVVRFPLAMAFLSVLLLFYLMLLEGRSSIVRSVLTFLVLSYAVLRHERPAMANVLALSALLQTLWNPFELFDPGFHLTYLSTAAILFVALPICNAIHWPRNIYRIVWSFIVVSPVIQFVLIPYQALIFHRVAFGSLLANLIAIPLSSFLIAAGVGALPLDVLQSTFAPVIRYPVRWFAESAEFFSGVWLKTIPEPSLSLVLIFYFAICLALIFRKKWKLLFAASITAILCFILIVTAKPSQPGGQLVLHFIDVGQGDSILIQYPDGTADLVDGGGFWNSQALDTGEAVLMPYLSHLGITKLHRIFLTHAHADHMNGLISLHRYIQSDLFYCTRKPISDTAFQKLIINTPTRVQGIRAGMKFRQGGVVLKVLAPDDCKYTRKVANDDSLVLQLEYQNRRILLAGDAELQTEESLVKNNSVTKLDVLKVAHHGSKTSTSKEFLNHFNPRMAVISVGRHNWFGHPHPKVLSELRRHHATILRTDLEGTIRIIIDDDEIKMDAFSLHHYSD